MCWSCSDLSAISEDHCSASRLLGTIIPWGEKGVMFVWGSGIPWWVCSGEVYWEGQLLLQFVGSPWRWNPGQCKHPLISNSLLGHSKVRWSWWGSLDCFDLTYAIISPSVCRQNYGWWLSCSFLWVLVKTFLLRGGIVVEHSSVSSGTQCQLLQSTCLWGVIWRAAAWNWHSHQRQPRRWYL